MRITLPSRRAAGLLAVSTIGLSSAVLGVTGVASAAPAVITGDDSYTASTEDGDTGFRVEPGYCTAFVQVVGGAGGEDGSATPGSPAGEVNLLMPVTAGQEFSFSAGTAAVADAHGSNTGVSSLNGTDGASGSGGGGAGSALLSGSSPVVTAAGGDGAGSGRGTGGGANAHTVQVVDGIGVFSGSTADPDNGSAWTGDGVVSVNVNGCEAPYAPSIDQVDAGETSATFTFWPSERDDYTAAADGYEYRLDGGAWTTLVTTPVAGGELGGSLTGLTSGHQYDLELRATSTYNGTSVASDVESFTPTHVVGAPENLTAAVGVSTVTLNWQPPTGETGISGYTAWASPEGAQSSAGTVFCPDMSHNAAARSCTVVVPAGVRYGVTVQADDGAQADWVLSDVVPAPSAPATLPKANGPLGTGSTTTLTAGKDVTLTGAGFLPGSTVTLVIYSTPTPLGTVVAADGTFSSAVTLPASLPNGVHHLVAAGLDASGNPYYLVTEVTVTGGTAAGTSGTTGSLAYTGFSALPYALGGLLAVAAGVGLLVASRRRARA